jgi:hypothetical protein
MTLTGTCLHVRVCLHQAVKISRLVQIWVPIGIQELTIGMSAKHIATMFGTAIALHTNICSIITNSTAVS